MDVKKAAVTTAKTVQKIWNTAMSIVILGLLVVLVWTVFINPNKLDVMMEDVNFPAYSQQSIKEVLNQFDPEGSWSFSAKSKKTMEKAGSGTAVWNGHVDVIENSGPSIKAPFVLEIGFQFNDDDSYQYRISKLQIYGYAWEGEELSTNFQVGQIMALIYGESMEMSFPAYDKFGNYAEIHAAKPGTYSGNRALEPVGPELPELEQPESPEADNAATANPAPLPAAAEMLAGCWQDIDGYGYYLFIGERDGRLCATIRIYDELEFVLNGTDADSASGSIMGRGTEPVYGLDVTREGINLYADLYISETDELQTYTFVPADMETCPYSDPYHPFQD